MGSAVTVVLCECGQAFMGDGEERCPDCVQGSDPLVCVECGTQLRWAVPKGLCGICDPEWVAA
jgi:hypothetical protein